MNDSCILPARFVDTDVISRGAHTSLVRAFDTSTQSPVAVKVIHAPSWMTPDEAASFMGRAAMDLAPAVDASHPSLARVLCLDRTSDSLIVAREYVEGKPLSHLFESRFALGEWEARRIARDIGAALDALSEAGAAHGAVSAANVIVRENGQFVLTDAMISRAAAQFSVAGMSCSLRSRREIGGDIHALASLVYQGLTGLPTCEGQRLEISRAMAGPIGRALARDRAAFKTASQFAEALTPVPTLAVFRHVWQPAAAVGLLASLATVGGNAVSEARRSASHLRPHHTRPVEIATPVEVMLPNLLNTLTADDALALKRAVRRQGAAVLANDDVARILELNDSQRAQIGTCLAQHRVHTGQVVEAAARGGLVDSASLMAELRSETNTRILSALNDTQRARWAQVETAARTGELTL